MAQKKTVYKQILEYFKASSQKDFKQTAYGIISATIFLLSFLIYRYFSSINSLNKELRKVNNLRKEAQNILSREIQVRKQKDIVSDIINKSKNFKLIQFFDSVVSSLGLQPNIKSREISTNELENLQDKGYNEISLNIFLNDVNMKQLIQMINEFEKNERVYIKSIQMTKSEATPTVDANVVIATVQPKEEEAEITEVL